VYLSSCERTDGGLGGVKHVLRRVNARVCVAENYVPVDLWLHHQRYKEMRDEDPIYEIWKWMIPGKLKMNLRTGHDGLCSV